MRNESEIKFRDSNPANLGGDFAVHSRPRILSRIALAATAVSLATCQGPAFVPQTEIDSKDFHDKATSLVPKNALPTIPTEEDLQKIISQTITPTPFQPGDVTPEPSPTPDVAQERAQHFEVGDQDMRSDFTLQLSGQSKVENAKVVPYLYQDGWPGFEELFHDWNGQLSIKELKKLFPGTDGKPGFDQLPILSNWPENSRFLTESQAEPQAGRVVLWGHSGVEILRGPLPFNSLKKAKPGDIETVIQNGAVQKYLVTSVLAVPVEVVANYQGIIGTDGINLLAQDVYSIYLSSLQADLSQGKITQEEFDQQKATLDDTFSKPGLDFITCEASNPLNPTNFDKRVIVSTVLIPNN